MKTRVWAIIALTMMATGSIKAQLYDQWASMEFKQWDFTPDNYYYSKVWRKILDLPWPLNDVYGWVPGDGWHDKGTWVPLTNVYIPVIFNPYALEAGHLDAVFEPDNYVNESWRQQSALRASATAEAVLYKLESDKEAEYWDKIRQLDVVTIADRSGVLSGLTGAATVTASERQESMDVVNESYELIEDENMKERMMEEYQALQEKVNVLDRAHMDNARKLVAMRDINRDYKDLAKRVKNTLALQYFKKATGETFKALNERHQWVFNLASDLGLDDDLQKVFQMVDLNKL